MSASRPRALLTLSIDRDTSAPDMGFAQQRSLDAVAMHLLEVLNRQRVRATWALDDPAAAPVAESIVATRGHEIAILGAESWAGPKAPRTHFGGELTRRAAQARAAGITISTLVTASTGLDEYYDQMVKQGLTAIRQPSIPAARFARRPMQPLTPRFGLWSFPVTCTLPGVRRVWPGGGGAGSARRWIDRAIRDAGLVHVVVDVALWVQRGYASQRVLDRVLRHAEQRRREGLLDLVTLGEAAKRLTDQCISKPSRSILRPAA